MAFRVTATDWTALLASAPNLSDKSYFKTGLAFTNDAGLNITLPVGTPMYVCVCVCVCVCVGWRSG